MNNAKTLLVLLLAGVVAGEAAAQQAEVQAEAERRRAEEQQATAARQRAVEHEAVDLEDEMRAAEVRLEEAARRIAELSTRRLPRFGGGRYGLEWTGRPMLGITIDGDSNDGPAEGVHVRGVTPGGPAFEAGLRADDIITAIDGESLSAESSAAANRQLLELIARVEEGVPLGVEYMRDGNVAEVTVTPVTRLARDFTFGMPRGGLHVPVAPTAPTAPGAPGFSEYAFFGGHGGWGDMEMITLTKDLGRYFGTDKGLLVVRAPSDENLKLEDGDVIHAIDGREPTSVSHAVRILGSYQSGETLKIDIMRDKRRQTLSVEMPDDRRSLARPDIGPAVAVDVVPDVRVRRQ